MAARGDMMQSALATAGAHAQVIAELTWVLVIGSTAIFVAVMALVWYALWRSPSPIASRRWLVGGGIAFPAVVLAALLVHALIVTNELSAHAADPALTIRVTGKRWWWDVRYAHPAARDALVTTANEIHLPVGRDVKLLLDTEDVIHSFWVPSLAGKVDMIPGRVNHLVLRAEKSGIYRGQCAEYCGAQHAHMALYVVAHEPAEFERWLEREARPAAEETAAPVQRGRALFAAAGCAQCHTVRGTAAAGRLGPDLTHVASRLSLAAGLLENNAGTLAGWIANAQALKPGNLMPSMKLAAEDLHALTAYMRSLQ